MTSEEAKALADTHVTLLLGNDTIEDVCKAVVDALAQMKDSMPAFLTWIQAITAPLSNQHSLASEQVPHYRDRVQKLNALLAKDPTFCATIDAYHTWKVAQSELTPEKAKESVGRIFYKVDCHDPLRDIMPLAVADQQHFGRAPESAKAWREEFEAQVKLRENDEDVQKLKKRILDGEER